jgi:ADP-dependent NAD(P)H-hydrate dehydratase / NAD(P)H-hydrate epimerase
MNPWIPVTITPDSQTARIESLMRVMPAIETLPYALYRAEQVREFDRIAIHEFGIPGEELMERAGHRAFACIRELWPELHEMLVVCGIGNNGGDGYVVARLALQAGLRVRVLQLGDEQRIQGDALSKARAWRGLGQELEPFVGLPGKPGLIVDAILGTGLEREVSGTWRNAVDLINHHQAPVFSLDIPSGLHSDTGRRMGCAIEAQACISFIGLKQGMFTGAGPDCCGRVFFDPLDIPARVYASQPLACRRIDWNRLRSRLAPRKRTAHKGDFGHLLVVGGDRGYSGAVRMAAEGAARCGAGLVSLGTHPEQAAWSNLGRPELMCRGIVDEYDPSLDELLGRANALVVGPGLGRTAWGEGLYRRLAVCRQPLLLDADGLYWLARYPDRREDRILTPHPGEAARLLQWEVSQVEADRFAACRALQVKFGGVVVLKGAGSLIASPESKPIALCSDGNPGMASGGFGDVLSGLIGAFLAQGMSLREAAEMGVCLHAAAADRAALDGETGMLAGDLFVPVRQLLNER